MRRLRRAADSVNLASFLSPKEIRFQCIKWEVESRPKILIVGVLEKRGLLGIRNLDLKMNVFFLTQFGRDLCLPNVTTGLFTFVSQFQFICGFFYEWPLANKPHNNLQLSFIAIRYLRLHKHATCPADSVGWNMFGAYKYARIFFVWFVLVIMHYVSYLSAAVTRRHAPDDVQHRNTTTG